MPTHEQVITALLERAEKAEAENARLREAVETQEGVISELMAALEVYANKSLWVQYERDGETTASIFTADESGLDCGVLSDGWLLAQAALTEKEPS